MKKNQLIIIGSLIGIFALIFLAIISNKKEGEKSKKEEQTVIHLPVRKVINQDKEMQIVSYGQVATNAEIDVAFEVQGKLEKGFAYLKPGMRFNKGQVLYRVNNEEAFYTLSARKTQLANLVVGIMPDIELDFASDRAKWLKFLEDLQPNTYLPALPEITNAKERMFLTSRGILSEYFNLKSAESRMEKYTYIAPFTGTVLETYSEPGAIANPGSKVARIAKTNDFEVKVPISSSNLKSYQKQGSVEFYTVEGEKVGRGAIARISDVINQQTQSVDVYYSIQPSENFKLYAGMYLNVSINQKTLRKSITVPRMAVSDNTISVLKNGQVYEKEILIVGNKPDSLYISGLADGEMVILEKVEIDRKGKLFKGIEK